MVASEELEKTLYRAYQQAKNRKHEFITPEHILLELTRDKVAVEVLIECDVDTGLLANDLEEHLNKNVSSIDSPHLPEPTYPEDVLAPFRVGRLWEMGRVDCTPKARKKRDNRGQYTGCLVQGSGIARRVFPESPRTYPFRRYKAYIPRKRRKPR